MKGGTLSFGLVHHGGGGWGGGKSFESYSSYHIKFLSFSRVNRVGEKALSITPFIMYNECPLALEKIQSYGVLTLFDMKRKTHVRKGTMFRSHAFDMQQCAQRTIHP